MVERLAATRSSGRDGRRRPPLAPPALLALLVVVLALGLSPGAVAPAALPAPGLQLGGVPPGGAPAPGSGPRQIAGYIRVIDGDTVEAWIDGKRVAIGILGVDAPQGNTDCGRQATALLRQLARGIWNLEEDPDPALAFDARMRRLYTVLTPAGVSVAEALVLAGVAKAEEKGEEGPKLKDAEEKAKRDQVGCLWRLEGTAGVPAETQRPLPLPLPLPRPQRSPPASPRTSSPPGWWSRWPSPHSRTGAP